MTPKIKKLSTILILITAATAVIILLMMKNNAIDPAELSPTAGEFVKEEQTQSSETDSGVSTITAEGSAATEDTNPTQDELVDTIQKETAAPPTYDDYGMGNNTPELDNGPSTFSKADMAVMWSPAPTPDGGVSWYTLMDVPYEQKIIEHELHIIADFTPELKAMVGKRIKINGYMIPMDASPEQTHFILMAFSHSCPFHMPGGYGGFIEVQADFPIKFTYDTMVIEGSFSLETDTAKGTFYKLSAAQKVAP